MPWNPPLHTAGSSASSSRRFHSGSDDTHDAPRQPTNVFSDWPTLFGDASGGGGGFSMSGGGGGGGGGAGDGDHPMGMSMDFGSVGAGQGQSMQRIGSSPAAAGPSRAAGYQGFGGGSGSGGGGGWDILRRRNSGSVPPVPTSSPSQAFMGHPGSFGANQALNALLSGGSTSSGSSGAGGGLGMSISPPNWGNPWTSGRGSISGGAFGGAGAGGGVGSFVGSLGALGTSFGRERDRQLEAKWGKEFWCCGKQFSGLHEFMEHCEDEHPNLSSDARVAAFNAQNPYAGMKHPRQSFSGGNGGGFNPATAATAGGSSAGLNANAAAVAAAAAAAAASSSSHGDAPIPPGMMDIEMDEPSAAAATGFVQQPVGGVIPGSAGSLTTGGQASAPVGAPWASAFRSQYQPVQTAGVAPALLSLNTSMPAFVGGGGGAAAAGGPASGTLTPGGSAIPQLSLPQLSGAALPPGFSLQGLPVGYPQPNNLAAQLAAANLGFASLPGSRNTSMPGTPILAAANATSVSAHASPKPMTREELEAKALRKAQRKAEKLAAAKEDALASGGEADHPEKRFPCPIEGCGKVYKQANGLKYHLTRSINSGHGNVAALGGIMGLLGEKGMEGLV